MIKNLNRNFRVKATLSLDECRTSRPMDFGVGPISKPKIKNLCEQNVSIFKFYIYLPNIYSTHRKRVISQKTIFLTNFESLYLLQFQS